MSEREHFSIDDWSQAKAEAYRQSVLRAVLAHNHRAEQIARLYRDPALLAHRIAKSQGAAPPMPAGRTPPEFPLSAYRTMTR